MIRIAGITLPETAVWTNEMEYGSPLSASAYADGREFIFSGGRSGKIDIYVPKVSGELTRETVLALKALADSAAVFTLMIGGRVMKAVFRHTDTALELRPVSARQEQAADDSYFGTIRLLEV